MELKTTHKEVHSKPITAITVNPLRREIITGSEDGSIKIWEAESGKTVQNLNKHQGWVTDLFFWQEAKLLVSASNDGLIITWSSSSIPHQVIKIGNPIYCVSWNSKREQIIIGLNKSVKAFNLVDGTSLSSPYLDEKCETVTHHTDIVKSIVCIDSRVYTASFDRALIMYETSSYPSDHTLHVISAFRQAHAAAITCLTIIRDSESNTWQILSGSFDRSVKIWTQDIQLIHKIEGLSGTITSICYIPLTKVLWVLCGSQDVSMFDPKSGENITEYVSSQKSKGTDSSKYQLLLLQYVPELQEVFCTTNRRTVMAWRYNSCAPVSTLQCKHIPEGLAYTGKSPILIFTGDCEGRITKWEQLQLNNFMYSSDSFNLQDMTRTLQFSNYDVITPLNGSERKSRSINKMLFVEDLDILVAVADDCHIYIWGFDEQAMNELRDSVPGGDNLFQTIEDGAVTNRVAGFTCKRVLNKHSQSVTGAAVVPQESYMSTSHLISCGADRRLCLWNLQLGTLVGTYTNSSGSEAASEEVITDVAYAKSRREFAYSSADKLIYIRKFATSVKSWNLLHVLQGHESEVSHVVWNDLCSMWVSGSDDCTLRTWSVHKHGYLETTTTVTDTQCPITALTCDLVNGAVIVGLQDIIRVYEGGTMKRVQTHTGHRDSVRGLMHVPERSQYISIAWDSSICIWNAYKSFNRQNNSPAPI
ncbi:uncharacterized WD repeat-containing protein alr3466-like isoform X1 [Bolinopsis microptera]|uniref:uncharacterized WD repeat-containing protein alr3466-like isoform X1 n=1 Tax=Bolinopsis microptera TaxID=2820187 RepID=UPI00307975FA